MDAGVGEVAFGIECGFAAHAGGGDGLAVDGVGAVSGGEDAFDACEGTEAVFEDDVAFVVEFDLAGEEFSIGGVADGGEHAFGFDVLDLVGLDIFGADCGDAVVVVAEDFFDDGVPDGGDFGIGESALGHDFGGAEGIAAVHEINLGGEFGEVGGFFNGGIAAADDDEGLVAEAGQGAIADGAGGDAVVFEFSFGGEAEVIGGGASGDDDGVGESELFIVAGEVVDVPDFEWLGGEIDAGDEVGFGAGAEAFGLLLEGAHHFLTVDAVDESGEVFDFGGEHELSAGHAVAVAAIAGEDEWSEGGAGGVDGGGPAGGTGADDDDFFGGGVGGHGDWILPRDGGDF